MILGGGVSFIHLCVRAGSECKMYVDCVRKVKGAGFNGRF